jgi:hypothetical protein
MELFKTNSITTAAGNAAGIAGAAGGLARSIAGKMADAGKTFSATLNGVQQTAAAGNDPRAKEARKAAEGLVSHALILPMLKQVRQSTFNKNGLFSPGDGEKTFGPEFDIEIADRIAQSPKMTLSTALANRLQARRPVKTQGKTQGVDVRG